jgi:MFS family permease
MFLHSVNSTLPDSHVFRGVVGDIWDTKTRGKAMLIFAVAPFAGPSLGPVISGWMAVGGASWRWLFWVLTMFVSLSLPLIDRDSWAVQSGFCLVAIFFTLPETYGPVLLAKKAQRLRKETGDERYYAPIEVRNVPIGRRLYNILAMPFKILFLEPMLLAITIYQSVSYCLPYLPIATDTL